MKNQTHIIRSISFPRVPIYKLWENIRWENDTVRECGKQILQPSSFGWVNIIINDKGLKFHHFPILVKVYKNWPAHICFIYIPHKIIGYKLNIQLLWIIFKLSHIEKIFLRSNRVFLILNNEMIKRMGSKKEI